MRTPHIASFIFILLIGIALFQLSDKQTNLPHSILTDNQQIHVAFENKNSNVLVTGSGTVTKILADDRKGRKHQKFIVKIDQKLTILIAHNIDIAPRINNLAAGDTLFFKGEYEWNKQGGVIHWTHHDPSGNHANGWLQHNNILYQ